MPLGGARITGTAEATSSSDSADISSELSVFSASVTRKSQYMFDIRLSALDTAAAEYRFRIERGGEEIARSDVFKACGVTIFEPQSVRFKCGSGGGETIALLITGQAADTAIAYDVELIHAP